LEPNLFQDHGDNLSLKHMFGSVGNSGISEYVSTALNLLHLSLFPASRMVGHEERYPLSWPPWARLSLSLRRAGFRDMTNTRIIFSLFLRRIGLDPPYLAFVPASRIFVAHLSVLSLSIRRAGLTHHTLTDAEEVGVPVFDTSRFRPASRILISMPS
jgi:hypothetical protein